MIRDQRRIKIQSPPEDIFNMIETMPNKFPIYKILETKPFLFLRLLCVDGFHSAIKAIGVDHPNDELILNIGDSFGPFRLSELKKPFNYWFTLHSFFFRCRTGYSIFPGDGGTILHFDLVSLKPRFTEKVYWFLIKPFHGVFANKVLRNIKESVENQGNESASSGQHNKANSAEAKNRAADD